MPPAAANPSQFPEPTPSGLEYLSFLFFYRQGGGGGGRGWAALPPEHRQMTPLAGDGSGPWMALWAWWPYSGARGMFRRGGGGDGGEKGGGRMLQAARAGGAVAGPGGRGAR